MKEYKLLDIAKSGAEKYFKEQIELLKIFSSIDCGTGNVEGNSKVLNVIEKLAYSIGVKVEYYEYEGVGKHAIIRINPNSKKGKIIINAHMDTIFEKGFAEKYPFSIKDDYFYGLGAADCKGGLVVSFYAIKIMIEAGLIPDKEIAIIYTCDEEVGSVTGQEIYKKEAKNADMAFVFEGGRYAEDGSNGIVTQRKGVATGVIDIVGREAHAGVDFESGRSATTELAHKIIMLHNMNEPENKIFYNVGPISGGRPYGVVAGSAHADVCVGLSTMSVYEKVKKDFKALEENILIDGCKVSAKTKILFPTMENREANHKIYEYYEKAANIYGMKVSEVAAPGSTDGCYLSTFGVPTVDALGPIVRNIHTTYESVFIPSVKERTAVFAITLGLL